MNDYIATYKKRHVEFDGICSGFLGSEKQIDIVKDFFQYFSNEDNFVLVDPVMGDHGKLYPTYNLLAYLYLCRKCNKEGKLPIRWSRNGSTNVGDGIPSLCDSDNVAKFFSAVSDLYELPIPDFVFKFPYRNTTN